MEMSIWSIGFRVIVESEVESVFVSMMDAVTSRLVPPNVEPTPHRVADTIINADLEFGWVKQAVEVSVTDESVTREELLSNLFEGRDI